MTEEKDKWIKTIAKLIELTQKDKLKWQAIQPESVQKKKPDDKIGSAFLTEYKDKKLILYQRSHEARSFADAWDRAFGARKQEKPRTIQSLVLELVDDNYLPLWNFPREEILKDLFSAIKYQVSGVNVFLDAILREE